MNVQLSSAPFLSGGAQARSVMYLPVLSWREAGAWSVGTEDKARLLFDCMCQHPSQKRKELVWDETLAWVAYLKCAEQATEGWTGHVNPQGYGPNFFARLYSYHLPSWYDQDDDANNIESLSHGGDGSVMQTWEGLLNSAPHAVHVLGLDPFFAEQTHVGVGMYTLPSSEYRYYWAIISAPPEE